ncbi:MAG: insulinase family protein [Anaerosolibacter sp.]|jgi:predicted Zn-dependent peptidase|uniref:EF-P 5-aminopentanol modification-associated protein YfmH n=1 Tax=Anaerosolibacter sp. TaxID=1872527 RepID=UPI00262DBA36|nr:pitrilysin family protein [Anaerosolibacter sp.]MDF2546903.1 insulinase family protein [Anaerosolibacter sp.]
MTIQTTSSELLHETIYSIERSDGLKVFFMPKEGYTKQYAVFATNYGSNDSKFKIASRGEEICVPDGIAHFLEHKLFEQPEGSVFDKFSELGSSVNAYTNFTSTCYLFSSTDKFYENLKLLLDFVREPYFTDESVEKEKGIIAQEIRMYEDNPNWKVFFNALKAMYHEHPVKIDIAGTVESIHKITKDDLYTCYNTFYTPRNMIVFIVGALDKDEVFDFVDKTLNNGKKKEEALIQRIYPNEPDAIVKKEIEEKLSVSMPLFNIAFKDVDNGLHGRELLAKDISTRIILEMLFGRSSELFMKLYEEGLINDSFEHEYTGEIDYGHSMLGGESKNPHEVLNKILDHIALMKEKGLSQDDFDRIRKKQMGQHLGYYNSIEFIANTFVPYYFKGISLLDYIEILKEISFETVSERFRKHFDSDKCVISVIRPK